MDNLKIVKIYEKNVWLEKDIAGSIYVMLRYKEEKSEPFCYCQFNYDYRYTSNASIHSAAEKMAVSLGAEMPVEVKMREFKL